MKVISMEKIEYRIELPDPYESAYEKAMTKIREDLESRETEGIEAALKEHGFVKVRTCKNVADDYESESNHFVCSECNAHVFDAEEYYVGIRDHGDYHSEAIPWRYCPSCGAKVVSE